MRFRMDWRSIRFDWNRARAFLVAAEEGSYSAAARALGLTQPTVGRQVAALEAELEVALFERAGHRLALTPAGLSLVEHVRAMGDAATRVSLAASGQAASLIGEVCVSASELIAAAWLPALLAPLQRAHPGLVIEIVASNAPSDLRRREADIAVRNFRPNAPDLVARKLGDSDTYLYGSTAYLAALGGPTTPADLAAATFIGFDETDALLRHYQALGLPLTAANFRVRTASQHAQWALAQAGAGLCLMLADIGDGAPDMHRVLPDRVRLSFPTWLTAHREVRSSRRVRVVFDVLAAGLSARLGGAAGG